MIGDCILPKHYGRFLIIVAFLLLFDLAGCQPASASFPSAIEIRYSPLTNFGKNDLLDYAISPDGTSLYDYGGHQINLRTGKETSLGAFHGSFGNMLRLSPNGRYLSATISIPLSSNDSNSIDYSYIIYDLQTQKTINGVAKEGIPISWSPDSSRFLLSNLSMLVSTKDVKKVAFVDKTVDFRKIDNMSGDGMFLWDKDHNTPVGIISGCGFTCLRDNDLNSIKENEWKIIPIAEFTMTKNFSYFENIIAVPPPNAVIDWLFDPSGRYVLLAIWEQTMMPEKNAKSWSTNVTDSVLLLVDWRTKKSTELLRLSKVDKQHVVIQPSSIRWSTDGKTILVPREGAKALVLKIK